MGPSSTVQITNLSVQRKDGKTQTQFSFPEGIFYSNQLRRQITPMKDQNWLLLETDGYKQQNYAARTAETFVYEAKGKPFGKTVEVPYKNPETGKEQLIVRYIHPKYRDEINLMLILKQGFRGKQQLPALYFTNKKNQKIADVSELNETEVLILRGGVIEARRIKRVSGENFSYGGRDDLNLYTSDGALIGSFVRLGFYGRWYVDALIDPSYRLWVPNSNADAKVEKAIAEQPQIKIVASSDLKAGLKAMRKQAAQLTKIADGFAADAHRLLLKLDFD